MTENLVLGVQEVNVSGGDHRLAQFLAQPDDLPVVLPEVFIGFGFVFFVCQHEAVVRQRLDFQKVVKGRNAFQLVVAFPVENGLKQLARFAGRTDDQPLPQLKNVGLGHPGHPAEVLQIGIGNQVVQVAQTDLVLGKNNDVPCLPISDAAAGTQMGHGRVDGLQVVDVMLLFQLDHELRHDEAAGHGVVRRPVMVEVGQAQGIGDDVQLEFVQLGQKILRQNQGIRRGVMVVVAEALTFGADEAGVEVGIVGDQNPVADEIQKFGQNLFDFRCADKHFVGDAGQLHDFPFQRTLRVNEGLETVHFLTVFQHNSADLDDAVAAGGQAGSFQIEGDEFLIEGDVLLSVNHNAVVHVVYIISLTAVENLDILVGSGHLGLGGGLHGVGEGLGDAVVGDGDGLVTPCGRLLHGGGGVRQGVHVGHGGVQMQLHPLFPRGSVLPLGHGAGLHGVGLENHFALVSIFTQLALHPQDGTDLNVFQNGFGLSGLHKAADTDGVGVVRHVEFHHVGVAFFQLLVVHSEDLALHDDGSHVQTQLLHGNGRALEGLAVEGFAGGGGLVLLLRLSGGDGGKLLNLRFPHGLCGCKQRFSLQRVASLHGDMHRGGEPLPQYLFHRRDVLQKGFFSVGGELYREILFVPFPLCPGEGTPRHGVAADKQPHQFFRFDFLQLRFRVGRGQLQLLQAVQATNVLANLFQQPLGDVALGMQRHVDASGLGVNVRSGDSRLRKGCIQLLRRLIVRKHIQKENLFFHIVSLQCFNSFQQGREQLVIGELFHLHALFKNHAPAVAAGNADVRFPGFAGAVDHAAHDRHGDGLFTVFQRFVHPVHQTDQVDAGSSAGGAGDDVHAVLPKSRGLENVPGGVNLLHRVVGEADPDGIADAVQKQRADAHGGLDQTLPDGAGLGHADVEGIVTFGAEQPRGGYHGGDGGGLHGDAGVVKALFFQQLQMFKGAFHQRFGGGVAVFFQQTLVKTAAVDADADGDVLVLAHLHHGLDPVFAADVAGVDADFGRAALRGGNGKLIIKMNVRHQGQGRVLADVRKAPGGFHVGNRQPGDLAPGGGKLTDLLQAALHIRGFGIEHGLDDHRGAAADGNAAHQNLFCHRLHLLNRKMTSLNIIIAIRASSRIMPAPCR